MKHTAMDRRIETLKHSVAIEELQPHRVVSDLSEVKDLEPTNHSGPCVKRALYSKTMGHTFTSHPGEYCVLD